MINPYCSRRLERIMKKFAIGVLTMALTLSMTAAVWADEPSKVIVFDENGAGEVKDKEPEAQPAQPTGEMKGYLALGSDLTSDQLTKVLDIFGIPVTDLGSYNVVYTTNAEEHASLDKYIDPSIIGTKSLSSVLVKNAEAGHGVIVTTTNINFCTTNMYRNALITAGVTDADIIVAAPTQISGTAALIGALKAYSQMSGKEVSQEALDTSLDELVTTGELTGSITNAEAEEFISYVKAQVAANDLDTEEEIDAVIRQGMKDYNVTLTEEEITKIKQLMLKIKAMGIDYSVLLDQADDIYAKYKDKIDAGTFRIEDVNVEDLGLGKIVSNAVSNFFSEVGNTVKDFFSGLFS